MNAIADAVKDEYPDKIIDTLAYQYTRKPPAHVRPRPNVVVRLCSIECCFSHPLESDPFNASFRDDLEGWSKISRRLWVWDYVINYAHSILPFPNLYVLKPNIDFYIKHGVTGIYEEANYYSRGGELAELRTYILAKTLWDPTYDTDHAIDEFLAAYYGPAAKPIREYLDLLQASVHAHPDVHMGIYVKPDWGYLTPELLAEAAAVRPGRGGRGRRCHAAPSRAGRPAAGHVRPNPARREGPGGSCRPPRPVRDDRPPRKGSPTWARGRTGRWRSGWRQRGASS